MKINMSNLARNQEDLEDLFEIRDLIREWQKVYAWLPTKINDNTIIWLDYVEVCYPDAEVLEIKSSFDPWDEDEIKVLERENKPTDPFFASDYPMAFIDYELEWGEPIYREFIPRENTIRE